MKVSILSNGKITTTQYRNVTIDGEVSALGGGGIEVETDPEFSKWKNTTGSKLVADVSTLSEEVATKASVDSVTTLNNTVSANTDAIDALEVDIATKADADNVYTKTEVNATLESYVKTEDLPETPDLSIYATTDSVNTGLAAKADKSVVDANTALITELTTCVTTLGCTVESKADANTVTELNSKVTELCALTACVYEVADNAYGQATTVYAILCNNGFMDSQPSISSFCTSTINIAPCAGYCASACIYSTFESLMLNSNNGITLSACSGANILSYEYSSLGFIDPCSKTLHSYINVGCATPENGCLATWEESNSIYINSYHDIYIDSEHQTYLKGSLNLMYGTCADSSINAITPVDITYNGRTLAVLNGIGCSGATPSLDIYGQYLRLFVDAGSSGYDSYKFIDFIEYTPEGSCEVYYIPRYSKE